LSGDATRNRSARACVDQPLADAQHLAVPIRNSNKTRASGDSATTPLAANNFLKGEAFSLSGEFLERTAESWDDVFLEERNKKPLKRMLKLFNDKGKAFANRGVIMTGPPGTGKTLSGRVIRSPAGTHGQQVDQTVTDVVGGSPAGSGPSGKRYSRQFCR
jgi:hypothetical protein